MKLVVLISGSGSNLQAFIDAIDAGSLKAEIALVLSNKAGAYGLERATEAGITTAVVDHRAFESREDFDQALVDTLQPLNVDLVILAGFMRILTPVFINGFSGRLLNIHPSLLPRYPGLHTHQRAIDAGDSHGGATVHFVTEELDGGPPILQARVSLLAGDSAEELAARVLVREHHIYPLAAQWFADDRLALTAQGAILDGVLLPETGFLLAD
jgi:phosphoribosylglycinamide formyltransferase-1